MKSTESLVRRIRDEVAKTVVGQEETFRLLLVTLLARGHAILEGVPGLAKTLLVHSLAKALDLPWGRIQFTPDMVPSDITGTEVLESTEGVREFRFVKGPVFTHILLADEINRTPPKTQSALLEAMQERHVTVLGRTHAIPDPFFVFATQNPLEQEGTYPLPEAQLDRFLLHIAMGYPSRSEELSILDADPGRVEGIRPVVSREELLEWISVSENLPVADKLKEYVLALVRGTRPGETALPEVNASVKWGAGPRASQMLLRAAKAWAILEGKALLDKESVDAVVLPVLRHRIILNYGARADGKTPETVVSAVQRSVEAAL